MRVQSRELRGWHRECLVETMLRLALLGCLVACTNAQIHRLPDCPDCGRGEARHGVWAAAGEGSIAATPGGGVVTLEANAVVFYDRAMRETRRVALDTEDAAIVAAAGDDTYVLSRARRALTLSAIDAGGVRWREHIGSDPGGIVGDNALDAGPDGPFLYGLLDIALPRFVATGPQVVALARDDGAVRWSQSFPSGQLEIVPDDAGGAYVASAEQASFPGDQVIVRRYDRSGAIVWTQAIAGALLPAPRGVSSTALTAQGDLAVVGKFAGEPLSVGDRTLDAVAGRAWTTYLAVLDHATGAPAAPRVIGDASAGVREPTHMIAIPPGDLVIASMPFLRTSGFDIDIEIVGPTGAPSEIQLGGNGDQIVRGLVASDDGALWLSVSNFEESLYPDGATLEVGSDRFSEQGIYVLKLAL